MDSSVIHSNGRATLGARYPTYITSRSTCEVGGGRPRGMIWGTKATGHTGYGGESVLGAEMIAEDADKVDWHFVKNSSKIERHKPTEVGGDPEVRVK